MSPTIQSWRSGFAAPLLVGVLALAATAQAYSDGRRHTVGANRPVFDAPHYLGAGLGIGTLGALPAPLAMPLLLAPAAPAVEASAVPAEPVAMAPQVPVVATADVAGPLAIIPPAATRARSATAAHRVTGRGAAPHVQTRGAIRHTAARDERRTRVRVTAPSTRVTVKEHRVRVSAPHTRVAVDEGRVRVRAPYVDLDIRF